jgi:DMSO/TMAO reductase YedYZ molybdopterin-dependent catalytic subunit
MSPSSREPLCFMSRRVFVRGVGGLAAGAALSSWTACKVSPGAAAPHPDAGAHPTGIAACLPFLTPLDDFYRQYGGRATVDGWSMPDLDASHTLGVSGLVDSEQSFTLADLESDEANHQTVVKTMICVLGYRSAAIWTGVPLRVLLDRAGIDRSRAVRVRFVGADGFENNLRIEDIYDSPADLFEPLVAFRIYGEPLPRELGFPFRLLLGDRDRKSVV